MPVTSGGAEPFGVLIITNQKISKDPVLCTTIGLPSITDVLEEGLHEFLLEVQKSLDRIGDEVVQTTMFYPIESGPEEQQDQQQQ